MIRHVRELMDLTGRWWDWRVDLWDSSTLRLVADNDLTYHHSVEVSFIDVAWAATADTFHHPTFRPATPAEHEFAQQVINEAGHELYAWDAETSAGTVPMMIVAQSVRIVEGLVRHV
ncbi:hypothetical protein AB0J72_18225 [Dactylosporangium sp. NPDC049742]|uniref:hypothetical protein n=1 Tax=Dactylosporangium sp. NPDC049742 TaxID=3154737 RepID=UPI00343B4127